MSARTQEFQVHAIGERPKGSYCLGMSILAIIIASHCGAPAGEARAGDGGRIFDPHLHLVPAGTRSYVQDLVLVQEYNSYYRLIKRRASPSLRARFS